MPTSAPHLDFRPVTASGELDPDILAYARIFGTPESALTGKVQDFLAYAIARFIGTTPKGERTNVRANVPEPTGADAEEATRIERRFRLHDEILPAESDRYVTDLLILMGTAWPSRLRWAHAVTHMSCLRAYMISALDRFLRATQPQDSLEKIVNPHHNCLPVEPGWQAPSKDEVMIGTESHLARWITRQSPDTDRNFYELHFVDAMAPVPDKRASTDDGLDAYIERLAAAEARSPYWELGEEPMTIGVVSSNPHWIFQALATERKIRDAKGKGVLRGNYRVVVLAYPLSWGLSSHVYVLGGLVRAILQWALLNQPDTVPSDEEIMAWAARLKTAA